MQIAIFNVNGQHGVFQISHVLFIAQSYTVCVLHGYTTINLQNAAHFLNFLIENKKVVNTYFNSNKSAFNESTYV